MPLPGLHNLENAAAAALVALELGGSPEAIEQALPRFPGVARRFEVVGVTPAGIRVVDDYAHNAGEDPRRRSPRRRPDATGSSRSFSRTASAPRGSCARSSP